MPRFDAVLKTLVDRHPEDWLRLLGLPESPVEILDTDLSAVSSQADRVLLVREPTPRILHLEFQSGPDANLDRRALRYNVQLHEKLLLPVHSVVILLRPAAWVKGNLGRVSYASPFGRSKLQFSYELVRLWRQPTESILRGGLGTLPLAPLTQVSRGTLPQVLTAMDTRIGNEAAPAEGADLRTSAYILMGLRYAPSVTNALMAKVAKMRESSTYQLILEEGRQEGRQEGWQQGLETGRQESLTALQRSLLTLGSRRFGTPSDTTRARVEGIRSIEHLEHVTERLLDVSSWDELLKDV